MRILLLCSKVKSASDVDNSFGSLTWDEVGIESCMNKLYLFV